jgi:hypothetical protein
MNQILKRQTSRSHYGSKVPAVTGVVKRWTNSTESIYYMCVLCIDQIKFTGVETVINTHVYPEYSLI